MILQIRHAYDLTGKYEPAKLIVSREKAKLIVSREKIGNEFDEGWSAKEAAVISVNEEILLMLINGGMLGGRYVRNPPETVGIIGSDYILRASGNGLDLEYSLVGSPTQRQIQTATASLRDKLQAVYPNFSDFQHF